MRVDFVQALKSLSKQNVQYQSGNAYMLWTDSKLISARVVAFRDMIFERMNLPLDLLSPISEP